MGFGCSFNQKDLGSESGGGEGGYDGFLALKGVGERVKGLIVDGDGGDGGRKGMTAALTSENCDFEASFEKLVEDGWAKVASGLRGHLVSA